MKRRPKLNLPEANPINFVPHITAPKLLINGRYDESAPLDTEVMPFLELLSKPKQLSLTASGHVPPIEERVPVINQWLDTTMGKVKLENQVLSLTAYRTA